MNSTVVIIGSHPRTRAEYDFSRTDADVWLFNEAISGKENKWARRADAIFQMHAEPIWRNPANRNDQNHILWLKNESGKCGVCGGKGEIKVAGKDIACYGCEGTGTYSPPAERMNTTVYMQDVYADIPASARFPLTEIQDMLHGDPDNFLSSSVAYGIALACFLGTYTRIEVYGVAMETHTEYQYQREGVAFWKGFAMGRGISFYYADPAFRCPMYGYDTEVALPYDVFPARIAELLPSIEIESENYRKAATELQKAADAFEAGDNDSDHLLPKVEAVLKIGNTLGILDGSRQENERYKQKADVMRESAGDFVFSRQEFESATGALQKSIKEVETRFAAFGGQLGLIHQAITRAAKGSTKRTQQIGAYQQLMNVYLQCNNQRAVYQGAMQENFKYMQRLDAGVRAAGGEKSEVVLLEMLNGAQVAV